MRAKDLQGSEAAMPVEEGEPSEGSGTWDEAAVQTDVPAANREAELKEGQVGVAEDGEQDERDDDDLDDESIFPCDNCQQDFDCLADLTEHRTNHCPAEPRMWPVISAEESVEGYMLLSEKSKGGSEEGAQ
ncbi:hypothetical protein CHARACLAT_004250 [Characodon lateralis]|uniref:C2H2-type domain-containing protein n=1 Tax=Characodon lateralis TaxID=208331 RepID=A0ABU7DE79_9TELE|nr:hypothetical protein [Characodon lateralis]